MNAETGVSRSPAMSNGGFNVAPTIKNPSPEVSGDGSWCRESLLSVARKKLTASPLRLRSAPPTNALAVRALLRHLLTSIAAPPLGRQEDARRQRILQSPSTEEGRFRPRAAAS